MFYLLYTTCLVFIIYCEQKRKKNFFKTRRELLNNLAQKHLVKHEMANLRNYQFKEGHAVTW